MIMSNATTALRRSKLDKTYCATCTRKANNEARNSDLMDISIPWYRLHLLTMSSCNKILFKDTKVSSCSAMQNKAAIIISNVTQGPFVRDECNRCFSGDEDADMH